MTEAEAQKLADKENMEQMFKLCPFFDRNCKSICIAYIPAEPFLRIVQENDEWGIKYPGCKRLVNA